MDEQEVRRNLADLLDALDAHLAVLWLPAARTLARLLARAAGVGGTVPLARLDALRDAAAEQVARIVGAHPAASFDALGAPRTPLARLVMGGARTAAEMAAEPAAAVARSALAGDARALAALTSRPAPPGYRPIFDPVRTWVDPAGYRLSDRLWQSGEDVRARLDVLLETGIREGRQATKLAADVEQFLTLEGRTQATQTPYGSKGLYAPRRLARTETTRAWGAATVEAARLSPFAAGVRWSLSGAHPKSDECDANAGRDSGLGAGVYRPGDVPRYPNHPNCLCVLSPAPARDIEAVAADLGRWVRGEIQLPGDVGLAPLDPAALADAITGSPVAQGVQA